MELAGVVGIHPDGLTLRDLVIMAESKQAAEWERSAAQMCLLANINRNKKTKIFKPDDFNPFKRTAQKEVIYDQKAAMAALKSMAKKERKKC